VTPDLDDTLPAAGPSAVRCLRCGTRAPDEPSRDRSEQIAYFCEACRTGILDAPGATLVLPGYELGDRLGSGGMGAVFRARHLETGEVGALKVLLPRSALSERARRLFVREGQTRLVHPRIVKVHDFQEVGPGVFCMAMELVDGPSAADLLRASPGGLDPDRARRIVAEALEGLAYAHAQGVVHRDVKDANLLVGKTGTKLGDFGLAKSFQQSGRSGFTRTGEMGGSIPYMAPEQIADFRAAGPPADIFSAGATLYRLLSGATPHDEVPGVDPLVVALLRPIVPLASRKPSLPADLLAVVERALAREPRARFASADEMRAALG
jgi:serine/threonine protein kinase